MGAQGTATLDFGVFPGTSDISVAVTGQAGILSGSLVEAWVLPADTADHTADEHMLETLKVFAGSIVAGVGFTIYGFNTSQLNEPLEKAARDPFKATSVQTLGSPLPEVGGIGTRLYGQFNIAWVWN
jgi:hypothetical protein